MDATKMQFHHHMIPETRIYSLFQEAAGPVVQWFGRVILVEVSSAIHAAVDGRSPTINRQWAVCTLLSYQP